ncbi:MAG TPA: hypothetical protein VES19_13920, partial [Candidatus Limnocylindrales bacterium]|nr:hypothetical protein [Candidatus Limnocylindrales bacterium]
MTDAAVALPAAPVATTAPAARQPSIVPSWVVYGLQFIAVGAWTAFAANYFAAMGLDVAVIGVFAAVPSAV